MLRRKRVYDEAGGTIVGTRKDLHMLATVKNKRIPAVDINASFPVSLFLLLLRDAGSTKYYVLCFRAD